MRRTPPVQAAPRLDQEGNPKLPTADEIARAAEDSAYTSRPTSLSDAGEAVPSHTQDRFSKEGRTLDELRQQRRRETWQREQDALSAYERFRLELERAERLGTDVHRELAALERTVRNMRRKNDRRAA
jgi:hypothetical protein